MHLENYDYLKHYNIAQHFHAVKSETSFHTLPQYQRYREELARQDRTRMKSLAELSVDCCVTEFQRIFFREGQPDRKLALRSHVQLAPIWFEGILERSAEMEEYLTPRILKSCLGYRDELQWRTIDLKHFVCCRDGYLEEGDMENVTGSSLPVRQLSFCTKRMTSIMMSHLSVVASNLEVLEIEWGSANGGHLEPRPEEDSSAVCRFGMPRLRRLEVNFKCVPTSLMFDCVDMLSFSTRLKVLKLTSLNVEPEVFGDFRSVERHSSALASCVRASVNLERFELRESFVNDVNRLIGALESLRAVRSIVIDWLVGEYESRDYRLDLSRLATASPRLETLELSGSLYPADHVEMYRDIGIDYLGHCLHASDRLNLRAVGKRFSGTDLRLKVSRDSVATFGRLESETL